MQGVGFCVLFSNIFQNIEGLSRALSYSRIFSFLENIHRTGSFADQNTASAPASVRGTLSIYSQRYSRIIHQEHVFGEQQMLALADYIRAALMLKFNTRTVG